MGPGHLALWPLLTTVLTVYNPLTPYWLAVNILLDTILGVGFFFGLVYLQPWAFDGARGKLKRAQDRAAIRKANVRFYNHWNDFWGALDGEAHEKIIDDPGFKERINGMFAVFGWLIYTYLTIIVWFGVVGVALTLILSKGLVNPLSWSGFYYDVLFARANAQPNGAHIWSYLTVPLFVFVIAYKLRPKDLGSLGLVGDIYQAIAGGAFLVAMHEGLWNILYYASYYQFLSWVDLTNVLRDVSFNVMAVLFILTFWKYRKRTIPMQIFIYPTLVYLGFLFAWLAFGLPITTINNPSYSIGLYQETIWFSNPWVNLTELGGWLLIFIVYSIAVIKLKPKDLLKPR